MNELGVTDSRADAPGTLIEAEFNPKVRNYWLLSGTVILVVSVVGIVFLPLWWILGLWGTGRYLDRMRCTLTERALKVERGMLIRQEMTVPLDKITDVGLVEGPIMRLLDLQAVRIETAGQSTQDAAIRLVGVRRAREFRDRVLAQRDLLTDRKEVRGERGSTESNPEGSLALLGEIRDTLRRIEERLPRPGDAV
ncbi:MAG: PH domain-containing protein [Longimicrobiales bacterium]|nr:PH domain-containing protein [Longimicrobiales bacterium]